MARTTVEIDTQIDHDPSYFEDEVIDQEEVAQEERDNELLRICEGELDLSAGYDDDELVENRKQALDYYFGNPRGDELEGRSEAQSMDVADMVEATLAEIMPLYSNPQLASFGAVSGKDVEQAKIESRACNHAFMELNEGWSVLYQAVKDALLQRNAMVDVYVQETIVPKYESYKGITEFELAQLTQNPDAEVIDWEETENMLFDVTIRINQVKKKLIAENFAPEDFLFVVNHRGHNPGDMRFSARRIITTKSDLIAEGHDKDLIDALPAYTEEDRVDSQARNVTYDEDEFDSYATEYVEIFKAFILYDYDGDGIAELNKVLFSRKAKGGGLISREWADFVTFASGSPFLMSHRFIGMSMFDKLKPTQDHKTAFLRQWLDNANHMNNRRLEVVENQVNMEDVLNSRPGGAVRTKSKGVVTPIPVDDIGPSCENALNYLDTVRSERGGASLDMQTSEIPIGDRVGSQGVERQYASKEKIAALIARTLAETLVRQIYLLVHANLRTSFIGNYDLQYNDQWIQTDPSKWLQRERLTLDIGMSMGERKAKINTLSSMLDLQIKAMEFEAEDVMVNRKKIYDLIMDIGYCSGLQNPERYWIDPDSPEAQKALHNKMESARAQNEEAKAMQRMIFEYQKHIEAQKDKIKMYEIETKKLNEMKDRYQDMIKHSDKMLKEFTELELEYNTDIANQGQSEKA